MSTSDKMFGTIENLMSGGYVPTFADGVESLAKLFTPLKAGEFGRVLDPSAGYGNALITFAHRVNMNPFGVEENSERGSVLVSRLGLDNAICTDMMTTTITANSMSVLFINPPYFKAEEGDRVEHEMVRHAYKWLAKDGIAVIIIYRHNVNAEFLQWLWRRSSNILPFFMETQPGYKREYEQIALICQRGDTPRYISELESNNAQFNEYFTQWLKVFLNPQKVVSTTTTQTNDDWEQVYIEALDQYVPDPSWTAKTVTEESIMTPFPFKDASEERFGAARLGEAMAELLNSDTDLLDVAIAAEGEAMFELPSTVRDLKTFQPSSFTDEQLAHAVATSGLSTTSAIDELLNLTPDAVSLRPPTEMRRRQAGGLIASGAVGTVSFENEDAVRHYVKSVTRRDIVAVKNETTDTNGDKKGKNIVTIQNRPKTSIFTLSEKGDVTEISDDEGLQKFVKEHATTFLDEVRDNYPPIWQIDNPQKEAYFELTKDVRALGIHDMTGTQKHVSSAMLATLEERRGVILVGQMGTGKTLMSIATMSMMRDKALNARFSTRKLRKIGGAAIMPGEVVAMLVPPITSENWRGEIEGGLKAAGNYQIFIFDTDATYADFADMDKLSKSAKAASKRCKTAWASGDEPDNADKEQANVLIFAIFTETVAKMQEGWIHTPAIKSVYKEKGRFGAVSGKDGKPLPVFVDSKTGAALIERKSKDSITYAAKTRFRLKKSGSGDGNKSWFSNGVLAKSAKKFDGLASKFLGMNEYLDEAIQENRTALEKVIERAAKNSMIARDIERNGTKKYTHKPLNVNFTCIQYRESRLAKWKYLCQFKQDIPEGFEHETRIYAHNTKSWITHEQQAVIEIRARRAKHDAANTGLVPLWQHARIRSIITGDDGKTARERINRVPLPSTMIAHNIKEEDYLIGTEGWKQGRPVSMGDYFLRLFKGRIALFVGDELHQYKSGAGTGRGIIMTRFANAARKSIGLTGTIYGGKASSVFHLLFLFSDEVREQYPDPSDPDVLERWVESMGVLEHTITTELTNDGTITGAKPVESKPQEAPGASPLLLKVLLNVAIFVGMKDMGKKLVKFTQMPVPIKMSYSESVRFHAASNELLDYLLERIKEYEDGSFAGQYFQSMIGLTSANHRTEKVYHTRKLTKIEYATRQLQNVDGQTPVVKLHPDANVRPEDIFVKAQVLVAIIPALPKDHISSKEQWLVEMVKGEVARGRGVCVYVSQSATKDIQPRLKELIDLHVPEAKSLILPKSISTKKRANYIKNKAKEGVNVLFCNPKMVEVGINMLSFQTLCFYETASSLYIMSQASRRAFRLNQTDECIVYYPFTYSDSDTPTMEQRAVNMVGRKELAAAFLSGEEGAGLSALADTDGDNLQKEIMSQITNNDGSESTFVDTRLIFDDINDVDSLVPTYEDFVAKSYEWDKESPMLGKAESASLAGYIAYIRSFTVKQADSLGFEAEESNGTEDKLNEIIAKVEPGTTISDIMPAIELDANPMTAEEKFHDLCRSMKMPSNNGKFKSANGAYILVPDAVEIPKLYGTENIAPEDKIVKVKLFKDAWTWYITEYNPETRVAFGLVDSFEREWGYIDINELEELGADTLPVERDVWFNPAPMKEILPEMFAKLVEETPEIITVNAKNGVFVVGDFVVVGDNPNKWEISKFDAEGYVSLIHVPNNGSVRVGNHADDLEHYATWKLRQDQVEELIEEEVATEPVVGFEAQEVIPEPVVEEEAAPTLAEQIASEILLGMSELTDDGQKDPETFTPEFEWDTLFTNFLKRLPAEKRRSVFQFMNSEANYPGVGTLERRFFVQRSAEALFDRTKLDEPKGSIKFAIGDFGATSSEALYLEFIYRQCGIRDLKNGTEIISNWNVDMSHADILKAS